MVISSRKLRSFLLAIEPLVLPSSLWACRGVSASFFSNIIHHFSTYLRTPEPTITSVILQLLPSPLYNSSSSHSAVSLLHGLILKTPRCLPVRRPSLYLLSTPQIRRFRADSSHHLLQLLDPAAVCLKFPCSPFSPPSGRTAHDAQSWRYSAFCNLEVG